MSAQIRTAAPKKTSSADDAGIARIVSGARQHFFAHGFRGVTMDDLAAELGMSKKTLYARFPSKSALLEAVIAEKFRDVDAELAKVIAACEADCIAALRELLACIRRHMEELQPSFLRDVAREAPELFKLVQANRRAVIQRHFGKLLSEGRKAGMIRKDLPVELAIEILIGAADAVANPQKLLELGISPKTALSTIITIFLEGMITDKGRRKL